MSCGGNCKCSVGKIVGKKDNSIKISKLTSNIFWDTQAGRCFKNEGELLKLKQDIEKLLDLVNSHLIEED